MDNAQTALIVGLGGVFSTALAGIFPSFFSYRLERRRLEISDRETRWTQKITSHKLRIELSDQALESLTNFLGSADKLSRGSDPIIANNSRSFRMSAVADLVRYSQIATQVEIDAIRQFVESSHKTLEVSDSVASGQRVLEVMMEVATKSSFGLLEEIREQPEVTKDGL